MKYHHIMGTVMSRRLGKSLGVNLIPGKICSLDCVYCEAGRTQILTSERRAYFSVDEVIDELHCYINENPDIDFITYSGAGEPTLYSQLGEVSRRIKKEFGRYKLALITNGTLFYRKDVRQDAGIADLVMPSLDAVSTEVFGMVNRPEISLDNKKIIGGLCDFRQEYNGQIWLEFFVVPGVNDFPEELKLIKDAVKRINPDRLQLNSLDRPAPDNEVSAAPRMHLEELKKYFADTGIFTEVISRVPQDSKKTEAEVLELLAGGAVPIEEIRNRFGDCDNAVSNLTAEGKIEMAENAGVSFYQLKR